jgi:hypothetical protein
MIVLSEKPHKAASSLPGNASLRRRHSYARLHRSVQSQHQADRTGWNDWRRLHAPFLRHVGLRSKSLKGPCQCRMNTRVLAVLTTAVTAPCREAGSSFLLTHPKTASPLNSVGEPEVGCWRAPPRNRVTHRRNTPCLRAREETSDIIHAEGVRGDGYHPRRRRAKCSVPGSGLREPKPSRRARWQQQDHTARRRDTISQWCWVTFDIAR